MADLITALALAVTLEGIAYALFPDAMKRLMADVALVDGRPSTTNEAEVAGLPVRVPMPGESLRIGPGGGAPRP